MNRLVPEDGVIRQGVEGCVGRGRRFGVGCEQGVLVIVKIHGGFWWITERRRVILRSASRESLLQNKINSRITNG